MDIATLVGLLGGFGIHRFYVGPISWGVVYLIFFWIIAVMLKKQIWKDVK